LQVSPSAFSPQLPPMHRFGVTQSPSFAQLALHLLVAGSHLMLPQGCAVTGRQAPAPSQFDDGVCVLVMVEQLSVPHGVERLAFWQAPFPSHFPFSPHGGAATHWAATVGKPPAPMLLQVPVDPVSAQLLQVSVHAVLQQTPSAQ
jgi:hypothetical protein